MNRWKFFKTGEINHANSSHKKADNTRQSGHASSSSPRPAGGFLVLGSALSEWTGLLGKLQARSRLFRTNGGLMPRQLAPGRTCRLPSIRVRGVLWTTLSRVSHAESWDVCVCGGWFPGDPTGSVCRLGHQGACLLLCPRGDHLPAWVLPFRLPPGLSQDSGLGRTCRCDGEKVTPVLCTPGIRSVRGPASKHSVRTDTQNVTQGDMGTRQQGRGVFFISDRQGGSFKSRWGSPDSRGVQILGRARWDEAPLWPCWGP